MPVRPCLTCGALIASGSYCRKHDAKRRRPRNPARGSGWAAAKWSASVLAQTGGRYAVRGCRTPYDRVAPHHVVALADGGVADGPGVPLCHRHHSQVTAADAQRRATGA
jgi:hypothetical protein